ncbi:hypothetical protein LCL99_05500 [Halomonas denitrificans]|uniref:hypothetical protein n=1 Tax=Halomonas TaxID=2745 RepID=UPI001A8CC7D8|nr:MULTISPECIES: hypothetical protein [Halomonas]MED5297047.1 hypothetical protein [Pseudomonadota bacterium]MBN8413049.1 hypothetical protein [Halomonas litopenaei]MBY5925345.1 hypothetical protein [Halomonas sp. DP4Y7-2]MBY5929175.1 hypothetical protein [Halomonas sp. DP8Y7-3]MBY5968252.1 hypothetical protein [Halomonas denitrificans]
MLPSFVRPSSWRGWLLLGIFGVIVLAGVWPVIEWINRAELVLGVPAIVAWSYVILLCCVLAMLLGNRLLREKGEDDGEH